MLLQLVHVTPMRDIRLKLRIQKFMIVKIIRTQHNTPNSHRIPMTVMVIIIYTQ